MKTKSAKKEEVARRWYVVDAEGQTLGRMATKIASVLRGKHKPDYTPHVDTGDFVVVVNAAKVKLTGNKEQDKMYHYHTGWAGHVVSRNAATLRAGDATEIVDLAVRGMLPKTGLGRHMFDKLKVYAGPEHPHAAQKPEPLSI